MQRGYKSVTLDDIAVSLKLKKATLYYHFPDGKEQLYMAVIERCFAKHRDQFSRIVKQELEGNGIQKTLFEIGRWLCSQPPMNTSRMLANDLPLLSGSNKKKIRVMLQDMAEPLAAVFNEASRRKLLRADAKPLMGLFFNLMESIHQSKLYSDMPQENVLELFLDVYLYGAMKR